MKAKDVMNLLNISRSTLYLYHRDGKIKGKKLDNGYYDYDKQSILKLMKSDTRNDVIYSRVSTYKQKKIYKHKLIKLKNIVKIIIYLFLIFILIYLLD